MVDGGRQADRWMSASIVVHVRLSCSGCTANSGGAGRQAWHAKVLGAKPGMPAGALGDNEAMCSCVRDIHGAARQALALLGEFNTWEPKPEHWAIKNDFGVWSLFLPDGADGSPVIVHRWGVYAVMHGIPNT